MTAETSVLMDDRRLIERPMANVLKLFGRPVRVTQTWTQEAHERDFLQGKVTELLNTPQLGCATTSALLLELMARAQVHVPARFPEMSNHLSILRAIFSMAGVLEYRTIDGH